MIYSVLWVFVVLIQCHCSNITRKDGYCIMYGNVPGAKFNVPSNTPAQPMTGEVYNILKNTCPHLAINGPTSTTSCCDLEQVKVLQTQIQLSFIVLGQCPACYTNFINMWCEFTCSPNQSKFLGYTYDNKTDPYADYYVSESFANDLFNSCKDVIYSGLNKPALNILCGMSAESCTPMKLFTAVGSTKYAPFAINFHIGQNVTNITNNNLKMFKCNALVPNPITGSTSPKCSCQDCPTSCALPVPQKHVEKDDTILGLKKIYFIVGLCSLLWIVLFLTISIVCWIFLKKRTVVESQSEISLKDYQNDSAAEPNKEHPSKDNFNTSNNYYCSRETFSELGYKFEKIMQEAFRITGTRCAMHPGIVILCSFVVILVFSLGLIKLEVVTNPVDLWTSKNSQARLEKEYFDATFGPFYRTEQVIITGDNKKAEEMYQTTSGAEKEVVKFSGLIQKNVLKQILHLQQTLMNLEASYNLEKVSLNDICLQPLSPDNTECAVYSVLQYWQLNETKLDQCFTKDGTDCGNKTLESKEDWHDHFIGCTRAPTEMKNGNYRNQPCMSSFGAPVTPELVLGGFANAKYSQAQAIIMTFVVKNNNDEEQNKKAEAWERVFLDYLKSWKANEAWKQNLNIEYSSERSILDEITRASESDVGTIAISYVLMFLYIAFGLGQYKSVSRLMIDAQITVGVSGVIMVLLSVVSAIGVFSYANVEVTLIIIEVIPFLVLAVGVDNLFIFMEVLQNDKALPNESIPEHIGRVLGLVGPGMLLSSFSQVVAFAFGSIADMPAVSTFSKFASLSVAFNFILQVTTLMAVVSLDSQRRAGNRLDVLCCIAKHEDDASTEQCLLGGEYLKKFIKVVYAPWLMLYPVRIFVVVLFSIWLAASICCIPSIEIGLDQTLPLPKDSYLVGYFDHLSKYLKTGAPVYFIVKDGYDYTNTEKQNLLCGTKGCKDDSLTGQIFLNSKNSETSKIALPASSWIDDYFSWISPNGQCCRILNYTTNVTNNAQFVSTNLTFCPSTSSSQHACYSCLRKGNVDIRPTKSEFETYLPWFLKDNPTDNCAKGGKASYEHAVELTNQNVYNTSRVKASYFLSYHTVLTTSQDFIDALKQSKEIALNISSTIKHKVIAYSVFYVFYEQYLHIVENTWKNLLITLSAIFVVTLLLMGFNIVIAICVCLTIALIVVDLMGMMYFWNIPLNAVSLVNLVMATGISVEFCSHIARAYTTNTGMTRVQKAQAAVAEMGSSVLTGITFSNIVGVFILAFAKTKLFEVFYFRMYMGMTIIGALHGLVFLPVLLSYVGTETRTNLHGKR